ncbi:PQQ-like beta-propeller repeat protein [bacterium]|nr:PQQ-like beta-propeller repeat protein [bacterium]
MKIKRRGCLISILIVILILCAGAWFFWWSTNAAGDLVWIPSKIPPATKNPPAVVTEPAGWPCWKGPMHDDSSPIRNIRKDWSKGLPEVWSVDYLCKGAKSMSWSAPAIQGNRLVVPGRDEKHDLLFCLDPEDGRLIWIKKYEAPAGNNYGQGHRATPAIDGDQVTTVSREGLIRCHTLFDGTLIWSNRLTDLGCIPPEWGISGSPLVWNDRVILHAGGEALAVALDKTDGHVLWKSAAGKGSYTSPVLLKWQNRELVVLYHPEGVSFIDPATGDFVYQLGLDKDNTDMTCVTPVIDGSRIFVSALRGGQSVLIRMEDSGPEIVWRSRDILAYHTNPFIIGNHIYSYSGMTLDNKMGRFVCVSLETGKTAWKTGDLGMGTTIFADGHFICLDLRGTLFLVKPDPERFDPVTEFAAAMPDVKKRVWTKPVIAGDNIYLRHGNRLICYRLKD